MAKVNLVQVDDRIIHGQVIADWIYQTKNSKVIIADNNLAENAFLSNIILLSAPSGINIEITSIANLIVKYDESKPDNKKTFVMFKTIESLKSAYEKGFKFEKVRITGMRAEPGKKLVFRMISLSQKEAEILKNLNDDGVKIIFQSVPAGRYINLQSILKKYFINL